MPTPTLSPALAQEAITAVVDAIRDGCYFGERERAGQRSAIEAASEKLGTNHSTIWKRLKRAEELYGFTVEAAMVPEPVKVDDDDLPDGFEVINRAADLNAKEIASAHKKWRRWIRVRKEPFGIAIFGDMHADNKGTDLHRLKSDLALCAASGVRAVNIGDTLDNFHYTGKLSKVQAHNRMSEKEGLAVARWIVRDSGVKFDAHILGNHDAWAGGPYAHLFMEWARQAKHPSKFYDWIVSITYDWGDGQYELLAAHDFKGNSIHNPLHGLFRRAKDDGTADGYAAGHRHTAADGSFENAFRGKRYSFGRVGSYKKWDGHAHRAGFDQQTEGASCMFVINPLSEDLSGRCQVLPSIAEGLEYLDMKRAKYPHMRPSA